MMEQHRAIENLIDSIFISLPRNKSNFVLRVACNLASLNRVQSKKRKMRMRDPHFAILYTRTPQEVEHNKAWAVHDHLLLVFTESWLGDNHGKGRLMKSAWYGGKGERGGKCLEAYSHIFLSLSLSFSLSLSLFLNYPKSAFGHTKRFLTPHG